jgi:hypothetical protein
MPTKITQTPDLSEAERREARALAEALNELRSRRNAIELRRLLAKAFGDHEAVALESEASK